MDIGEILKKKKSENFWVDKKDRLIMLKASDFMVALSVSLR